MSDEVDYLTQEKYDEIKDELETLKHKKRQEIAENLEYAKSLGDLSENAEYHAAREAQAELEDRIKKLEILLKNAEIIHDHETGVVGAGSTVKLKNTDTGETFTYTLVGSEEADMLVGKISNKSPLGHAMVGKKKKEDFAVETPGGKNTYTIVSIN